jgi:hypothetical protein
MLPPGTRFSKADLPRSRAGKPIARAVGWWNLLRPRFLFYVFVVIFLVLLILGLTIFRV